MIRILLVDDHPVVLEGVAARLRREPDFVVAGSATTGEEALRSLAAQPVDVVVLDLQMPETNALPLVQRIAASGIAVVVFSLYAEGAMAAEVVAAGARWAVPKSAPIESLVQAVRAASKGEGMAVGTDPDPLAQLSRREREIFERVVAGAPLKVVAVDLGLSTGTVHTYAHRIRTKLGVETIPDVVRYAHARGLHLKR